MNTRLAVCFLTATLLSHSVLADIASAQTVSPFVEAAHAEAQTDLDFTDERDFERARRGFLSTLDDLPIPGAEGSPVPTFDPDNLNFLKGDRPDTVHPALWRQSQLNAMHGLFEVTNGIWQVRGFDLSKNSRARYNLYFGNFDGNPANLDSLTPEQAGRQHRAHRYGGTRPSLCVGRRLAPPDGRHG